MAQRKSQFHFHITAYGIPPHFHMTFINTLLFILKFIDKYEQHYYCIRIVVKYSTGAEILKKHIAGIENWISHQENNAVPFSHIATVERMTDLAKQNCAEHTNCLKRSK
ncbi:MAG: hypothetical protein NC429_13725 [Lachnospiraceae bacterium]|nr:hypothetical protein [Lachnospiraceae bacterium]